MTLQLSQSNGASDAFAAAVALIGDGIGDFVWLSNATGWPIYQNPMSRQYVGYSDAVLRIQGWSVLCHPDDRTSFVDAWDHAVVTSQPFDIEFRCRRRDGAYRWFHCQAAPVHAESATHGLHWIATLTDVHRHRVLESELDRAVRNRDEFLATLAHEIRSPLQAIQQAMQVVKTPGISEKTTQQMHEVINRQLSLLLRFSEDSLDLSRVCWNAMSLVPASITLEALVAQATEGIRPIIEKSGLSLDVELDEPDCEMIADPLRLTQALVNLMGNAAKFGKAGGRVKLRACCEDGHAVFEVRDWGCGIDPQRLEEIFELFARAPDAKRARVDGLGIGLAIAQHVARLHGGTLVAHSDGLGCGSQFTMRVPLAATVAALSQPSTCRPSAARTAAVQGAHPIMCAGVSPNANQRFD